MVRPSKTVTRGAVAFFAVATPVCVAAGVALLLGVAWVLDAAGASALIDPPRPSTDEAHLRLAGLTYRDLSGTNACSVDCGGHEAGWRWARDNRIADPADCGGRSRSFVEGCWAYGEAVVRITG